ncbi:MAG: chloride channel [Monoraphidium minutum]|nr:MAG: chloride channel [Monoraphidium minutum]
MAPAHPQTRPFGAACAAAQDKHARMARSPQDWRARKAYQWLVALACGVMTGALAFSLNWVTEALVYVKGGAMLSRIHPDGGFFLPWLALVGVSSAYAGMAGLLVSRLSPMAAGSGIPHMRSWINGVDVPRCVAPMTLMVKSVGVTLAIASGLVAGKEGPYIQCGGILGYLTGCLGNAWARGVALRLFRETDKPPAAAALAKAAADSPDSPPARVAVVEPREASDFASVGTSAGVAVAFNAPVAGVAYAVEEGNTVYSVAMLWKAVFSAVAAIWAMGLLNVAVKHGRRLWSAQVTLTDDLSFRSTDQISSIFWYHTWEVPFMMLLGAATGLMGALWTGLCTRLLALRARWIPDSRPTLRNLEVVLVAALTATVWIAVCYFSPCVPMPPNSAELTQAHNKHFKMNFFDEATSMWPQMWCKSENEYSLWGQLFAMPIESSVRALMSVQHSPSSGDDAASFLFSMTALGMFVACAFAGLLAAYGVAAPTGIFIPTMAIGAAAGRIVGRGMLAAVDAARLDLQVSLPTWSAVGAAGLLAGNTRLLLSTILIVSETSGSGPALVPMILAAVASKLVADSINKCVYDWQVEHARLPFLEDKALLPPRDMASLLNTQVADAMSPGPPAVLPPRPTLRQVLEWLRRHPHSLIPVVEGDGGAATDTESAAAADGCAGRDAAGGGSGGGDGPKAAAAARGDGPILRGAVYRWQLISCLKHPTLLHTLLLQPGGGDGGGAPLAPAAAAAGANVVVEVAPGSPLDALEPARRGALFALLTQGPPNTTPEAAEAQEGALIDSYLGPPQGAPATGGSSSGVAAGARCCGVRRRRQRGRQQAAATAPDGSRSGPGSQGGPDAGAASTSGADADGGNGLPPQQAHSQPAANGSLSNGAAAVDAAPDAQAQRGDGRDSSSSGGGDGGPAAALLARRVDLAPLFQSSPFDLPPDAPLEAAHELMRHLGVHSVLVTARPEPRLLGLITRRTLLAREHGGAPGH